MRVHSPTFLVCVDELTWFEDSQPFCGPSRSSEVKHNAILAWRSLGAVLARQLTQRLSECSISYLGCCFLQLTPCIDLFAILPGSHAFMCSFKLCMTISSFVTVHSLRLTKHKPLERAELRKLCKTLAIDTFSFQPSLFSTESATDQMFPTALASQPDSYS